LQHICIKEYKHYKTRTATPLPKGASHPTSLALPTFPRPPRTLHSPRTLCLRFLAHRLDVEESVLSTRDQFFSLLQSTTKRIKQQQVLGSLSLANE
jgi:hypothetical protein